MSYELRKNVSYADIARKSKIRRALYDRRRWIENPEGKKWRRMMRGDK